MTVNLLGKGMIISDFGISILDFEFAKTLKPVLYPVQTIALAIALDISQ
jgi:hypothetical protein